MNYLNLVFYGFLPVFVVIYYLLPGRWRYAAVAVGSCVFYGWVRPELVLVLLGVTALIYVGGLVMARCPGRVAYAIFFCLTVAVLVFCKWPGHWLPVGLSFIIFQACTYLGDVHRGNVAVERNPLRLLAFVAFFPTVLSGPIQKARQLLPQIAAPRDFDGDMAKKGTIVFIWGLFEKVMVANRLQTIVGTGGASDVVAAVAFSLYIYADFSSYSDMARGVAMLLGIDISKNFNNPYLSSSPSEFWNRWHMTLNSWFVEYIYIPLGGNRKGLLRKYLNVMVVFAVSGLWHGSDWHFLAWGVINGLLVVVWQLLERFIKLDDGVESIHFIKQAVTFWLITLTWMFFHNGVMESLQIIRHIAVFNPMHLVDPGLLSIAGSPEGTFVAVVATIIFVIVQLKRVDEAGEYIRFCRQPFILQAALMGLLVCVCVFAACDTGAMVNTEFLYFEF